MLTHQLTLTELLDDPMTRAVMAADRVDPIALKATLSVVAEKLQLNSAAYQRRNWAGWSDQTWLSSSLKGPEYYSDHGGRSPQANWMCRMATATDPSRGAPLVRHILE